MQFKTLEEAKARRPIGEKDISSVFNLLAIQCMIRLGEIPDPILQKPQVNLVGARFYYSLLEVLQEKTRGNLSDDEQRLLQDLLQNLALILKKKSRE